MAEEFRNKRHESGEERNESQREGKEIEIPAVRHVGPTLESDESKEGQELADAVTLLENAHSGASRYEPRPDAPARREDPEPLKTRLPGDTSSDPHTDVGEDNAATAQQRGESNRK